jgi:GH43 family beta-xylosidase
VFVDADGRTTLFFQGNNDRGRTWFLSSVPVAWSNNVPTPSTTGSVTRPAGKADTFNNPLLPAGADPWATFHDGFYYYMHTTARNLTVWKTPSIPDLRIAERKVVWRPPPGEPYSRNLWAPEIHYLEGKWYIYVAADDGQNANHRIWVLENTSADPLEGEWTMKGKLSDPTDRWAIDASVFEHRGRLYAIWSGWEGDVNEAQHIYIAALKNPWTIEGPRVRISTPTHAWEAVGDLNGAGTPHDPTHVDVNEGPTVLKHGDRLFLVYAASGCWTESYCLGMLTASADSDLLDPASWTKSPEPVFSSRPEAQAYATGHCSFFQSPDGTEDWILYHANPEPGQGCGPHRSPRAQRITWTDDGFPEFGQPIPLATSIRRPSGDGGARKP